LQGKLVFSREGFTSYFVLLDFQQQALDNALQEGRVFLSPVVAAELMSGHLTKAKQGELANFLRDLPLCDADVEHWLRVGILRSQLARKGLSVSTPDAHVAHAHVAHAHVAHAHVAQCAIDLDGYLLTEDKIFKRLAKPWGLRLL